MAFYSFKGGVGRTTVLALLATALARTGKKVICLDLDLEAPGLGDFMGADPSPSLLEILLTHAAIGQMPAEDPVQWLEIHDGKVGVVAAGSLDKNYLEKLARLDYLAASQNTASPVAQALKKLLERLKGQHGPDYIFLDCRAGLHDLGGLSLTDFAHVDVIVGRDTPQNHAGIGLTLEVLGRRRAPAEQRLMVIQSFVPFPLGGESAKTTLARMRHQTWEACCRTIYRGDIPSEDSDQSPHYALPFPERSEVAAAPGIAEIDSVVLESSDLKQILSRLILLCEPENSDVG